MTGARRPDPIPGARAIEPDDIIVAGVLTALLLGYIGPVWGYLDQRAELRDERGRLAHAGAAPATRCAPARRLGQGRCWRPGPGSWG